MITASMFRIVFDPTGTPLVIRDWLQDGEASLPDWEQQVDIEPFPLADHQGIFPRANVTGTWEVQAVVDYASPAALAAGVLAARASVPTDNKPLAVRVLDLSAAATGTESERTASYYLAASCAIRRMVPQEGPLPNQITYRWTLAIGELALQP